MQEIVGVILVAFGLLLILLGVLAWLGVIKPPARPKPASGSSTFIDFLMALLDKAPWVVVVGLVLVVVGVLLLGVKIPFL